MATASALMAQVQAELGDPNADTSGGKFTSTAVYGWLDEAQKEWCIRLMPLRGIDSQTVVTNQDSFALASDAIMVDAIDSRRGWLKKAQNINLTDFLNQNTAVRTALATDPDLWMEWDNRAYVFPRYSGSSLTTTINASTLAAATTLTMASTGNLRSFGRIKGPGGEIVEYTGKTSTTITGCRRGLGNTTASAYASGDTVTQIDYNLWYRRTPISLASTASPEIRTAFHEKLKIYAKYLAYSVEGSFDKANAQLELWQKTIQDCMDAESKRTIKTDRIRDMDEQTISNMYGPI